nr:microtubule-associated protein futsch-like isoform X3 [Ipomoea batatas]
MSSDNCLRTNDWGTIVSMVGQMRTEVSDTATAAHLEVSWLKQILDDISTEDDGQLASVIRNTSLVSKAARKDLTQRKAELVIAERRPKDSLNVLNRVNEQQKGQSSLQTFEGFRIRENYGIVRVHCEDSGKELFAEKSQRCRSEPSH